MKMDNNYNSLRAKLNRKPVELPLKKTRKRRTRPSVSAVKVDVGIKEPKRPYTGYCELCIARLKLLEYHVVGDSGIWLCASCHRFAEYIDKNEKWVNLYLSHKERLKQGEPVEPSVSSTEYTGSLFTGYPLSDTLMTIMTKR